MWHIVITKLPAYICRTNDAHLFASFSYSLCSELLWPIFRKTRSLHFFFFACWSREKMMYLTVDVGCSQCWRNILTPQWQQTWPPWACVFFLYNVYFLGLLALLTGQLKIWQETGGERGGVTRSEGPQAGGRCSKGKASLHATPVLPTVINTWMCVFLSVSTSCRCGSTHRHNCALFVPAESKRRDTFV